MSREEEIMNFLNEKIFNPILSSPNATDDIKSGVRLTIARMSKLSADKMIQYYWSALSQDNSIGFSKKLKSAGLPRFEDVLEEFRDKFKI